MIVNPAYLGIWLLQMVCILFPMLLYQSFFRKKFGKKRIQKEILAVLCGLSIIICMTFPLSFGKGFILDFRFIPLIISFFYGGYSTGLVLTALMMAYRFLIGGIGMYIEGLGIPFFSLIIFAIILPRYDKWEQKKQVFFTYLCLTLSIIFLILETRDFKGYTFTQHEMTHWITFCILNYITFWMVIYLQTSLKEMEEMGTKVIQFEKNHALNHLIVYLSQQIYTPILSVKDSLKSLEKDSTLSPKQANTIIHATANLNKAEHSLKDYMTLLDPVENDHEEVELTSMLQETIEVINPFALLNNVELHFLSTAESHLLIKDFSLLRFALINIIKNGVEACSPGGRVDVFLHELIDQFYIIVEDNGPGLSADIISRLGTPIHSEKQNGTGLGISTAYKITESLGGKVEVESKTNVGTTFSLYFPKRNFIVTNKSTSALFSTDRLKTNPEGRS
ncbi:MAG: ATP-binding protein [Bacillota bacterium]|nr:ATP-binding protein [Bacillota bacterium]